MKSNFKKKLLYFIIYSIGMFFIFYFLITNEELLKSVIVTLVTGIGATYLTFWIASKRK